MATFKSAQSAGFTGSYKDWVAAGKPSGTAPTTSETKLTPERIRQKEEAARSLNVRAQETSRTEAERKQLESARTAQEKEQIRQQQQSTQQRQSLAQESAEQRLQAQSGFSRETGTVGGQFVAGREFIDQRQRQLAQQEAAAPEAPTFEPPEGATQLEMAQAESAYNKQLADFYQTQAAAGREELATVSAQVSDFGDQLRFNQEQIDRLVNNLNTQNTGLGDTVRNTLDQIAASGGQVELNEGTLRMIESMAATTPPDQLPQQINNLVTNTPAVNQNQPMVTDDLRMGMITPAQQYGSLSQSGATASQIITQRPDLAEYIQPDGTIINSEAGVGLIRNAGGESYKTPSGLMIPRNSSTGFADYNSLSPDQIANMSYVDVLAIDLATQQSSSDLKAFYTGQMLNHQYQKNRRDTALYQDEINNFYNNETNSLNMNKISQLQELDLERQRQQLSFDTSMRSLNDANARQNNRMKAMLDAYGLEGSTASMHIMSSMDLKFQQEASTLRRGYDINLASLANSTSLVKMNYANRLVEINQNKSIALDKLRNQFIDTENQIEQSVLLNRIDKITNKQNAYAEYVTKVKESQDKAQEEAQRQAAQAQENIWEQQKWYSEKMGMMMKVDENGAPSPVLDSEGNVIRTMNGIQTELNMKNYYDSMRTVTMKQDSETGEWFGFDKFGNRTSYGSYDMNGSPLAGFDLSDVQSGQQVTVGDTTLTIGMPYGPDQGNNSECVGTSRLFVPDLPGGLYTIEDKLRVANDGVNSSINGQQYVAPGVGSVAFFETGKSPGHAATITEMYYENGVHYMDLIDSNFDNKHTVGIRTKVPVNSAAGFYTSPTGNQVIKKPQTRLTKTQKRDFIDLQNKFNTRQEVKRFRDVEAAYGRIQATGLNPSPAGDLALIFNYMKMLDPGSVVREGEFANAQNSASVPETIRAKYNQVIRGERLTTDIRNDFLNQANNLLQSEQNLLGDVVEQFRQSSEMIGLPQDAFQQIVGQQSLKSQPIAESPAREKVAQQTRRTDFINVLREDPEIFLDEIIKQYYDNPTSQKRAREEFKRYFGDEWKQFKLGDVNEVNVADVLLTQ